MKMEEKKNYCCDCENWDDCYHGRKMDEIGYCGDGNNFAKFKPKIERDNMKFDCLKCGKIDEALFDGYHFGDRTLEGVMFKARKHDDGSCDVELAEGEWQKDPYLSKLDEKYWMAQANWNGSKTHSR